MNTITFSLPKYLACYVAGIVNNNSILVAIAKASLGYNMEDTITVTITEDEVFEVYRTLTIQQEGATSVYNKQLDTILLPMLADRPELAARIIDVDNGNVVRRNEFVNNGLATVESLQTAMSNN